MSSPEDFLVSSLQLMWSVCDDNNLFAYAIIMQFIPIIIFPLVLYCYKWGIVKGIWPLKQLLLFVFFI